MKKIITLKSEFHKLTKNSFLQVTNEKRKTVLSGVAEITSSLDCTFETLKEILENLHENEYYTNNDNFLVFDFTDIENRFYFSQLSEIYHRAEISNEQIADEMERTYSNLFDIPNYAEKKTKAETKQAFLVLIENLIFELQDVKSKIKKADNE